MPGLDDMGGMIHDSCHLFVKEAFTCFSLSVLRKWKIHQSTNPTSRRNDEQIPLLKLT